VPSGSTLFCFEASGQVRWRRDLGSEILTRPEVLKLKDRRLLLCGTASGKLFALDQDGKPIWDCETGETFSHTLAFLPRKGAEPLMIFTGLWGNLHAVDVRGRHVWTHLFRAKVRAAPLVLDVDGAGRSEIFVPTFHQHVYQFDEAGSLKDDIRLEGIMPSALTPISGDSSNRPDLLVTTTTLLAYRLRPGPPQSQYGPTPEPRNLHLQPPMGYEAGVRVSNPEGALLRAQITMTDAKGRKWMTGQVTARSAFEIPLPSMVRTGQWSFRATACGVAAKLPNDVVWKTPRTVPSAPQAPDSIHAWPTEPFGPFDETRLTAYGRKTTPGATNQVAIETIYLDGTSEGAFIVASTREEPTQVRLTLTRPVRRDGVAFGGTIVLREVVSTGSVNGEQVPDALPALDDAGLVRILSHRAAKIWLSLDAHNAEPGIYSSHITITPIATTTAKIELPLRLEVLDLRFPKEFPLKLCTWDYVPNQWFSNRVEAVLDDMSRHGVNVFPRSTIPPARLDAAGKLATDWSSLDAELARLEHRGTILFHLNHPPIVFAAPKTPEEKRTFEFEYIRALRDHLKERGRGYGDYAFYLLDEPGLDYGTNIPVLLDAGQLFREADPKLLTYTDPVPGLSWKDFERIESLVDIWAPNMRLVSGLLSRDPRIQRIAKAPTVWSYECVGQVKSLSPLRYNRANAWRAKFFRVNGIGFWTHCTTQADPWFPGKTINEEYALVYPGEVPVPSVRWEAVRDGLEDVAAIALLEEQIRRHRAAGTQNALVKEADRELQIALHDVMELSDEAFVESRDFLRAGDRVLSHTWTDVEVYRRHRSEIARLTLSLSAR
jgi:hypothetical protein